MVLPGCGAADRAKRDRNEVPGSSTSGTRPRSFRGLGRAAEHHLELDLRAALDLRAGRGAQEDRGRIGGEVVVPAEQVFPAVLGAGHLADERLVLVLVDVED